jgi:exopolysaccharide biosynthesis polyprenyl glycosylphosphotransferase
MASSPRYRPVNLRYRVMSVAGTVLLTVVAVAVANHPLVQRTFTTLVPIFNRLPVTVLSGTALLISLIVTLVVVGSLLAPLYKPRSRRTIDTLLLSQRQILIAWLTLAVIGYFDYTYRLPRSTLILTTALLIFILPVWFVAVQRYWTTNMERAVIVGDDSELIEPIIETAEDSIIGLVKLPGLHYVPLSYASMYADGGISTADPSQNDLDFSRFGEILVKHGIDTVILTFTESDRNLFFGMLDACYNHGVQVLVHRSHIDSVLTAAALPSDDLIEINLKPWDWQDYVIKRIFDIVFAAAGLVVLAPLMIPVSILIKIGSSGPIFYKQKRTAAFGKTFFLYKFRSMVVDAEQSSGVKLSDEDIGESDPRVTRIGRILRRTHFDEIPQLWSILVGDMSVVGPRPERPELDNEIRQNVNEWQRRWFVKPGLTGLAQVQNMSSHYPEKKVQYDVKYIREQSFWLDIKIVVRQILMVMNDVAMLAADRTRSKRNG